MKLGKEYFLIEWKTVCCKNGRDSLSAYPEKNIGNIVLKCTRRCMNTICLYVFWNFHEPGRRKMILPTERYSCGVLAVWLERMGCMS